ncbi:MAG: TIGR03087 family PEP-CTERM/XrtA system glycosyltransferase [Sphingobium sp.]|uniref:TIGR03087 family PEP-CTERM/XrtA system glycosyltransferase n=1 Tax=Sphingobium sp. TaxID=1912891 RepID=UPI0029B385C4|nr:TIGR03087 family PEP-CTERM/XrtA system glycosyltransferase [Sphingobium sp.]MDX3908958.1 TIGR03087 family PEP-CTERM/XrtA system glycosyltransferase [Sphingobium sp.]
MTVAPAGAGEILFLCHRIPFPPDRGDKIRSFNILRQLAEIAPVHVGCLADDERDLTFAPALEELTQSQLVLRRSGSRVAGGLRGLAKGQPLLVSLFDAPAMHDWVRRTLAERPIRAVFAYSVQMANFVPVLPPDVRFLMDFVDFDSAKYAAYGAGKFGPMGWINRREGRKLLAFEREVARRADVSTFVSEAEAAMFRDATGAGLDRVRALENGVALDYFDPVAAFPPISRDAGPLIVFTGQMDYRPNVEAVESFARQSLPSIRERYPDACFAIVGRGPSKAVLALRDLPGVLVTGSVDDVRGWLVAADVVVAPLRIARGIQNKVLEALAMARPVVASSQAAEGIDAIHDLHLLVASSPEKEAPMVLSLLDDPHRAASLGQSARERMIERYQWRHTLSALPELVLGGPSA